MALTRRGLEAFQGWSLLLERTLGHDMGGEVAIEFRREGVICSITAPLPK